MSLSVIGVTLTWNYLFLTEVWRHTPFCGWEEFTTTPEDMVVMFQLPLVDDHGVTGIVLTEQEERMMQLLNATPRISIK